MKKLPVEWAVVFIYHWWIKFVGFHLIATISKVHACNIFHQTYSRCTYRVWNLVPPKCRFARLMKVCSIFGSTMGLRNVSWIQRRRPLYRYICWYLDYWNVGHIKNTGLGNPMIIYRGISFTWPSYFSHIFWVFWPSSSLSCKLLLSILV